MDIAGAAVRKDGWFNVLTGLGVSGRDKRMSMEYSWVRYTESELEHLYATDDIAERVVNFIPDEGTREWIEIKYREEEKNKAILKELERLDVKCVFNKAWKWARLYGGSGVILVVDDGKELYQPLDFNSIRKIKSLTVLNKFELNTMKIIDNIENNDFGKQEIYSLNPRQGDSFGTLVHYTRVIRFNGTPLPRTLFEMNDNWDDSVLPKILNALRNYNLSHDSLAACVQDFRLMILKLKDLADMVGSDDDQKLLTRLQLMNMSKGVLNSIAIDAENEDISNLDTNFSNLDKVIEKVEARLVAATGLPHTIVLGEGASGTLGGGGESEDDNLKDYISAQQDLVLTNPINYILKAIQSAKQGPFKGSVDEELPWIFKSLYQQSDKEKAELHKMQAEADAIYIDRQVLSPETVAKSRFTPDGYSIETIPEEAYSEEHEMEDPVEENTEKENEDALEQTFEHTHFVSLSGVGSGYTGPANGAGENHTHTLPNGLETGPAIQLFGGGHIHQATTEEYTEAAVPVGTMNEINAVKMMHMDKPKECEIEYDGMKGIFTVKGMDERALQTIIISKEISKTEAEAESVAKKYGAPMKGGDETESSFRFRVKDPSEFKEGSFKSFKPPVSGVTLVFGELK